MHLQALPLTCKVRSLCTIGPLLQAYKTAGASKLTSGLEACLHVICVVGVLKVARKTNFCFLTAYFSHLSSAFTGTSFDMQGEISMHDWSPTIGLQD